MQQKASGMSGFLWCNEMKGCHKLVAGTIIVWWVVVNVSNYIDVWVHFWC